MNKLNYTKKATKQLRRITGVHVDRIVEAINALIDFPEVYKDVKALNNHDYGYRMRVGDYRVLFNFDNEAKIITIEEVKKRDERTY